MTEMEQNIDSALKQQPDYSRLEDLSVDVWRRIRTARVSHLKGVTIPFGLKVSAFALCLLAFVAISQVTFHSNQNHPDIFDLRFFSHQSIPSLNLASVNTYEYP